MQQWVTGPTRGVAHGRNPTPRGKSPSNRFANFRKCHGNPPGGRRRPRGRAPAGAISPRRPAAFARARRRAGPPLSAGTGAPKAAIPPGDAARPASF